MSPSRRAASSISMKRSRGSATERVSRVSKTSKEKTRISISFLRNPKQIQGEWNHPTMFRPQFSHHLQASPESEKTKSPPMPSATNRQPAPLGPLNEFHLR